MGKTKNEQLVEVTSRLRGLLNDMVPAEFMPPKDVVLAYLQQYDAAETVIQSLMSRYPTLAISPAEQEKWTGRRNIRRASSLEQKPKRKQKQATKPVQKRTTRVTREVATRQEGEQDIAKEPEPKPENEALTEPMKQEPVPDLAPVIENAAGNASESKEQLEPEKEPTPTKALEPAPAAEAEQEPGSGTEVGPEIRPLPVQEHEKEDVEEENTEDNGDYLNSTEQISLLDEIMGNFPRGKRLVEPMELSSRELAKALNKIDKNAKKEYTSAAIKNVKEMIENDPYTDFYMLSCLYEPWDNAEDILGVYLDYPTSCDLMEEFGVPQARRATKVNKLVLRRKRGTSMANELVKYEPEADIASEDNEEDRDRKGDVSNSGIEQFEPRYDTKKIVWPLVCWLCKEPMNRVKPYILCSSKCKRAYHVNCEGSKAIKLKLSMELPGVKVAERSIFGSKIKGAQNLKNADKPPNAVALTDATISMDADQEKGPVIADNLAGLDSVREEFPVKTDLASEKEKDPQSVNDSGSGGKLALSGASNRPVGSTGYIRVNRNCITRECLFCFNDYRGCSNCHKFHPAKRLMKCVAEACNTFYCYPKCLRGVRLIVPDRRVVEIHRLIYGHVKLLLDEMKRPIFICHGHTCWSCYDCDRYSYQWEALWRKEAHIHPDSFMSESWQKLRIACRGKVELSHLSKTKRIPRPPRYPDIYGYRSYMQSKRLSLFGIKGLRHESLYPLSDEDEPDEFYKTAIGVLLRCVRCERTWCTHCMHPDVNIIPHSAKQIICHDCIQIEVLQAMALDSKGTDDQLGTVNCETLDRHLEIQGEGPHEQFDDIVRHMDEIFSLRSKLPVKPRFLDEKMFIAEPDIDLRVPSQTSSTANDKKSGFTGEASRNDSSEYAKVEPTSLRKARKRVTKDQDEYDSADSVYEGGEKSGSEESEDIDEDYMDKRVVKRVKQGQENREHRVKMLVAAREELALQENSSDSDDGDHSGQEDFTEKMVINPMNNRQCPEFLQMVKECDKETVERLCTDFVYQTKNFVTAESLRALAAAATPQRCSCSVNCLKLCSNLAKQIECNNHNCALNEVNCGNRRFKYMGRPKLVLRSVKGKGIGTFATEAMEKKELVCEYVGEVITHDEFQRCLSSWSFAELDNENQSHWYIMKINKDAYIDSTHVGNVARFINHSCEPNCTIVPFNVNGTFRMGVFADRKIEAGEEVTYNYGFCSKGVGEGFQCLCGAESCRGVVGVQPDDTVESLEKLQSLRNLGAESDTMAQLTYDMASVYITKNKNRMKQQPGPIDIFTGMITAGDLYRYEMMQNRTEMQSNSTLGPDIHLPAHPMTDVLNDNTYVNNSLLNYIKLLVVGGISMKQWDLANTKLFAFAVPWGILALENSKASMTRALESSCSFPNFYESGKRFIQTVCIVKSRIMSNNQASENLQDIIDLTWGATDPCFACGGYGDCKYCEGCGDVLHNDNVCGEFYVNKDGLTVCTVCQNSDHRHQWLTASDADRETLAMELWCLRMERAYTKCKETFRSIIVQKLGSAQSEVDEDSDDSERESGRLYVRPESLLCTNEEFERFRKNPLSYYDKQIKYHNMCKNAIRNYECFW